MGLGEIHVGIPSAKQVRGPLIRSLFISDSVYHPSSRRIRTFFLDVMIFSISSKNLSWSVDEIFTNECFKLRWLKNSKMTLRVPPYPNWQPASTGPFVHVLLFLFPIPFLRNRGTGDRCVFSFPESSSWSWPSQRCEGAPRQGNEC